MAIRIMETTSGVRNAATTKAPMTAYLRLRFSKSTETMPSRARRASSTGSSNNSPKMSRSLMEKSRYSCMEGRVRMKSEPKLSRNLKPNGNTTK